ncbi:DUF5805 domain-containing protein [Halorussus litoreus]|uniref:DUF5805 domain-containing protein n=1 Tax=Halorussus litoreus TaxID=1710536 RepID=UPI000E2537B2|nr:DUF5805 domain-containing protein [Halorussus litoreus]
MSADENVDASRKTVKTFIPAYEKTEWKRHADELGMSQSEFVRTMVQAGRRDFEIEGKVSVGDGPDAATADGESSTGSATASANVAEGGDNPADTAEKDGTGGEGGAEGSGGDLREHVLAALSDADHLSWDELVERLTSDIEDRLEQALQELQADNRVQYSGRHGGYALLGGSNGD